MSSERIVFGVCRNRMFFHLLCFTHTRKSTEPIYSSEHCRNRRFLYVHTKKHNPWRVCASKDTATSMSTIITYRTVVVGLCTLLYSGDVKHILSTPTVNVVGIKTAKNYVESQNTIKDIQKFRHVWQSLFCDPGLPPSHTSHPFPLSCYFQTAFRVFWVRVTPEFRSKFTSCHAWRNLWVTNKPK